MKRFARRYREALKQLAQGIRDVAFPAGTWQLAQLGIVRCELAPT